MLLIIGWRGHHSEKDEPQHILQGKITTSMLDVMGISYDILDKDTIDAEMRLEKLVKQAQASNSPVALLVRRGVFEKGKINKQSNKKICFMREKAIEVVVDNLPRESFVIATTGMASRELYEVREKKKHKHSFDFLTVGGMGYASSIALAIAEQKKEKVIVCLDGDGAALMHMGTMALIGDLKLKNFIHIVLNNGAHDSVGGQETIARSFSLTKLAKVLGYDYIKQVKNPVELSKELNNVNAVSGLRFLEVLIDKGNRADLGRPTEAPLENKKIFMDTING